jgi:hypothetical protein
MSVNVPVRIDSRVALKIIKVLDELGNFIPGCNMRWPKNLKCKYLDARAELVYAIRHLASCNGVAHPCLSGSSRLFPAGQAGCFYAPAL